jgi:hypothetical protein
MPNNSDPNNLGFWQIFLFCIAIPLAVALISGCILLPPERKSAIRLIVKKKWRWIVERLYPRHKETPEEAEDRHHREMLESDDPGIWKS